jgi:hypothetical protein
MRRLQSRSLPAVLLALSCVLAAGAAGAQPAPAVSPVNASMDKADELYRQGNEAYKQNRLKDAYGFYKEAWTLKKSYDIAGNLGAVELAISMPRDAAEHLLHSLRQFPANGKPEARDKTRQRLEDALKQIGTLTIKVNVEGAEILVDGKSVGKAPLEQEIFVDAGTRRIEAKIDGYDPVRQQLQVAKGSTHQVALKLKKTPAPPPVTTTPARPSWTVPIIVAGASLSAAFFGTGIGLIVVSNNKSSEADEKLASLTSANGQAPCPGATDGLKAQCSELKGLRSDHDTFQNVAVGTFVLGGVVAAATVGSVFMFGSKRGKTEAAVSVAPSFGPSGGGLSARGTF